MQLSTTPKDPGMLKERMKDLVMSKCAAILWPQLRPALAAPIFSVIYCLQGLPEKYDEAQ